MMDLCILLYTYWTLLVLLDAPGLKASFTRSKASCERFPQCNCNSAPSVQVWLLNNTFMNPAGARLIIALVRDLL